MSEQTSENDESSDTSTGTDSDAGSGTDGGSTSGESSQEAQETREAGGVPDEDLPEDLRADKNPLAEDPEESEIGSDEGDGAPGGDMGQPG